MNWTGLKRRELGSNIANFQLHAAEQRAAGGQQHTCKGAERTWRIRLESTALEGDRDLGTEQAAFRPQMLSER